ncbi:Ribonuclease BN, partial [Pseudomonas syringae pv. maculicola]
MTSRTKRAASSTFPAWAAIIQCHCRRLTKPDHYLWQDRVLPEGQAAMIRNILKMGDERLLRIAPPVPAEM